MHIVISFHLCSILRSIFFFALMSVWTFFLRFDVHFYIFLRIDVRIGTFYRIDIRVLLFFALMLVLTLFFALMFILALFFALLLVLPFFFALMFVFTLFIALMFALPLFIALMFVLTLFFALMLFLTFYRIDVRIGTFLRIDVHFWVRIIFNCLPAEFRDVNYYILCLRMRHTQQRCIGEWLDDARTAALSEHSEAVVGWRHGVLSCTSALSDWLLFVLYCVPLNPEQK